MSWRYIVRKQEENRRKKEKFQSGFDRAYLGWKSKPWEQSFEAHNSFSLLKLKIIFLSLAGQFMVNDKVPRLDLEFQGIAEILSGREPYKKFRHSEFGTKVIKVELE